MVIIQRGYRTPVKEKHLEAAVKILKEEFKLVDAHLDPVRKDFGGCLVWEDEAGIGRYRVHLYAGNKLIEEIKYDTVVFHYWCNERLLKEILEQDPMKEALKKVYSKAKNPLEIGHLFVEENNIDEIIAKNNSY